MRFLVAPDSFKGTLTAEQAANSIAAGIRKVFPDARCAIHPIADGGEGTLDCINRIIGGTLHHTFVRLLDGLKESRPWLCFGQEHALIESAQCAGYRSEHQQRNPYRAFSLGVGDFIQDAVKAGSECVYVALGGSGTHDCGIGMATALGYRFFDSRGEMELDVPRTVIELLRSVRHIETPRKEGQPSIVALTDVDNPLCGKNGAAMTYAAQKGFRKNDLDMLDDATAQFASIVRKDIANISPEIPGTGAAGGLGFALATFCNAEIRSGIEWVLGVTEFCERCSAADVLVTGEGKVDTQTLHGKALSRIAAMAKGEGIPVVAFAGQVSGDVGDLTKALGFEEIVPVSQDGHVPENQERAFELLSGAAEQWAERWNASRER